MTENALCTYSGESLPLEVSGMAPGGHSNNPGQKELRHLQRHSIQYTKPHCSLVSPVDVVSISDT